MVHCVDLTGPPEKIIITSRGELRKGDIPLVVEKCVKSL